MRTRILILLAAMVVFAFAPACSQEKKPDPAQFAALCEEIVRCDAQVKQFPDPARSCAQMLVGIQEKYPQKLGELESCLKAQSCEQKNFASCLQSVVQGMGMPVP